LWQALVNGSWEPLDQLDIEGRRSILARRSAVAAPCFSKLTDRERQVLTHVALGHPNKQIAYTLGFTTPTVANLISRASRKLGIGNRVELIGLIRKSWGMHGNSS
jgi:DNA-binding NarL/FixJ family response regulator